ncbi:hypothetical protein TNCV_1607411 [Trichonephila clavipes]|nr:hypothetical protein TNCV_1607411 [Trichonephila clavipes]
MQEKNNSTRQHERNNSTGENNSTRQQERNNSTGENNSTQHQERNNSTLRCHRPPAPPLQQNRLFLPTYIKFYKIKINLK